MYDTDPDEAGRTWRKGSRAWKRLDGIHAAAVVITMVSLTTYLPIQRKPESGPRSVEWTRRWSPSSRCTASKSSAC
ncbi:MAG: hypothetical protein R2713_14550 [Ilumatobacteraceae bacterium]